MNECFRGLFDVFLSYLLVQTFCELQLLQELLLLVAEAVILFRTGALKEEKTNDMVNLPSSC